jgi:DAK2 domain fusion protein YloV
MRGELTNLGDSLVVAGDDEVVKVHIHTGDPGIVLSLCLQKGSIHDIKIDNMADQFQNTRWGASAAGKSRQDMAGAGLAVKDDDFDAENQIGVVAISSGDGLAKIFDSLGVHKIIAGGQSMNPSVEDIVDAVQSLPTEMVVVLPNNKNIKLAAEQAAKLLEKEVMVIDAKTLPQGIVAMLAFDPADSLVQNYTEMCNRARQVKTGEVTFAVRNALINKMQIEKDDIIGLFDGDLIVKGDSINGTTVDLIGAMMTGDEEIITFFYGQDVSSQQVEQLVEEIEAKYPALEVEVHYGGQPLYYYLFSLE